MCKTVKQANAHQNDGIRNHDHFVAHLIHDAADNRSGKEAGYSGNCKQKADHGGICTIEEDQHIRTKGKEHLLASAVEHFQHIIFAVFFMEIEAALGGVGFAFTLDAQSTNHAGCCQQSRTSEEELIRLCLYKERKGQHNDQIADKSTDLTDRALQAQGCTAVTGFCIAESQGALHAQLNVLTQGKHTDGQCGQNLQRRKYGVHTHTQQHDDSAYLVQRLRGEHVECGKNKDQCDARQLTEELRNAAIHFAHGNNFSQEVVQHTLVQTVRKPGDQNREQEQGHVPVLHKDLFDGIQLFHNCLSIPPHNCGKLAVALLHSV